MITLSAQYPRYGYRRIQVFLERQGLLMSVDRAYRLWSGAGLQVPRRRPRRRIAASRPPPATPAAANQVWAYDFVFDDCANGQQLKCLTVADEYTRESLAIDVAGSNPTTRDGGHKAVDRWAACAAFSVLQWRGIRLPRAAARGYAARSG
jgi:putative transposase